MRSEKTLVVTLGGTIESFYNPEEGTPKNVPVAGGADATVIPEVMRRMGLDEGCDFYPLAMRDSKHISRAELDHLLQHAGEQGYRQILIVQGTDTMPTHGQYLQQRIADLKEYLPSLGGARFVFTGAMGPLRDKHKQWREPSADPLQNERAKNDGWDNLRAARQDVAQDAPGVFVRIGQQLWPADRVKKVVQLDGSGPDAKVTHSEFQGVAAEATQQHRFD